MDDNLLRKLKDWRQTRASAEGVPLFRILSNKALEDIAGLKPSSKEELMKVNGIKDKRFDKYGLSLLNIVNDDTNFIDAKEEGADGKPLSISEYLNLLNGKLILCQAKICGEISSLDIRNSALYFSLKDSIDGSAINCLMWKSAYMLCGINFEIGMEIILEGYPDIYKSTGRLSFKTSSAELVGEGTLKKQYELLKAKLQKEGLLDISRKRPLPNFPQKIGLITSKSGAAIGDFQMNLGRYGFKVTLIDSRVEGQLAVRELLSAIRSFERRDIEVLVLIRGGGSFESLLPFNNEILAREVAKFPVPVLVGVGHERDISLIGLVADIAVSTPTAVAQTLNEPWQEAIAEVQLNRQKLLSKFTSVLAKNRADIQGGFQTIKEYFRGIFENFNNTEQAFLRGMTVFRARIFELKKQMERFPTVTRREMKNLFNQSRERVLVALRAPINYLTRAIRLVSMGIRFDTARQIFEGSISNARNSLISLEKLLETNNPERQLKLGYSIVRIGNAVARSIKNIKKGDIAQIQMQDGTFKSEVSEIRAHFKINE
ncbi:MAG: exodeoxyribonuclease VII large subunit [Patescibacteria group bacterium]